MTRDKFGKMVKNAREDIGLTQEELAKKVGIHVSYLSRIERGSENNPTKEVLENLGKLLKLKASDLLSL
jgi:transcriptional regulator with XRE-family HTH domain